MSRRLLSAVLLAAGALSISTPSADAQSLKDRLKKRAEESAKRKIEQRVDQRAGEATDAALDKAEGAIRCATTDTDCQEKAKADGKKVVTDDSAPKGGAPVEAAASDAAPAAGGADGATGASVNAMKPGTGAWANYDFKPGDRILYSDDFTKDEVGNFPQRMEFKEGALEIVEWQGSRYLRATSDSRFYLLIPEGLPERFTLEFDYTIPSNGEVWIFTEDDDRVRIEFGGDGRTEVNNYKTQVLANTRSADNDLDKLRRGRVLADGKYIKVYLDDRRTLNVPNADLPRGKKLQFYTDAHEKAPAMFGNFRLAAGGKKLYDAIAAEGRVATQGIYFDTGSDRIRPESSPTLKEIADMLKEHGDLKLTIEGHTDNVGQAASNQSLSEKRAAAVKAMLVSSYGVDASRLETKGLGASKPAATNDSAEGRQTNRRVELVKM